MPDKLISYPTSITHIVVLFCRFLRSKRFSVGPNEEADALQALTLLPIGHKRNFRQALQAVLVKNKYQYDHFAGLFDEFWNELEKFKKSKVKERPLHQQKKSTARQQQAQFEALKSWLNLKPATEEKAVAAYSDLNVLTKKDFAELSPDEMRLMMQLLQKLARKLAHRQGRLKKASRKYRHIDLKLTMRANMRRGGELTEFLYSENKERKLNLVLLCDVSKSMDLYSRFFIHLIYAFQNTYDKFETFVFSTALHRVTDILHNHPFAQAFDIISERVPHWSGGTTIGQCLQAFTNEYGYALVNKKTIVIILSDGWDKGAPAAMREAMRVIHKNSRKVIWLNPLAGSPQFSPATTGMDAALPYIDVLASAHNLESLKNAMLHLTRRRNLLAGPALSY